MNRRDFTKTCVASCMALGFWRQSRAQGVLIREDIRSFAASADKVKNLRDAVRELKHRAFDNPTSWFNMAAIHDIPASDPDANKVPKNIQDLWKQCHRDKSLFFLWHRAYVSSIERLMQDAIKKPEFRLPYWNWYQDPILPAIFRAPYEDAAGKTENPLYVKDRNAAANQGKPIWNPQIVTNFNNKDFTSFQDSLNGSEHSTIHMAVGTRTNMGQTTTAARDPIFWLHHTNIDRLLPVWIKMNNAADKVPKLFPAWVSTVYRFPTAAGPPETPSVEKIALGSMEALGYAYENVDPPAVARPPTPRRPASISIAHEGPRPLGATARALAITKSLEIGAAATIDLPIPASDAGGVHALGIERRPQAFTSVSVVLDNITISSLPEGVLSYQVYLNLPQADTAKASFDDHYLGSISLFALEHPRGDAHHDGGASTRFVVTGQLARQMRAAPKPPSRLSLSLIPVLAPGAKAPASGVLRIGQVRVEASTAAGR